MNIGKTATFALMATLPVSWLALPLLNSQEAKLTAQEIVARHLMSIGSDAARAALKSRVAQGSARFKIVVGGSGNLEGKEWLVSEGRKLQFMMKFANPNYRGEQFIFDGERVQVTSTQPGSRSLFGGFVYSQEVILREGLFGGVLSTAWPLLNLGERNPKLTYGGMKKIGEKELHEVRYIPQKAGDLQIFLYFEPETFRHVLTVYSLTIRSQIAERDEETARQLETRYKLEERFSDFKSVDGLTLPTHWDIRLDSQVPGSVAGYLARSSLLEWEVTQDQVTNNISLDSRNFAIK